MLSSTLWRTNSSGKRRPSSFSTRSWLTTTAFLSEPPSARPRDHNSSTRSAKAKVRARAISVLNDSGSNAMHIACVSINGWSKRISQSRIRLSAGSRRAHFPCASRPTGFRTWIQRRGRAHHGAAGVAQSGAHRAVAYLVEAGRNRRTPGPVVAHEPYAAVRDGRMQRQRDLGPGVQTRAHASDRIAQGPLATHRRLVSIHAGPEHARLP